MSELIAPSSEFATSFLQALDEFDAHDIRGFWQAGGNPRDIADYIKRTQQHERGENLPDRWVPSTTRWLVDGNEFIGHVNIRHELNDWLQYIGGHIGYSIRPSKHGQGYGSAILPFAIPIAKSLGIERALVTCNPDNVASKRIIEKSGGQLQDEITFDDQQVLRYWIDL